MNNVWEEALQEFDWGGGSSEKKVKNKSASAATTSSSSKKSNESSGRDTKSITSDSVPKVVVAKRGANEPAPANQADIGRGRLSKPQQQERVTPQEKLLGASMYPMGDLLGVKSERVKKPKSKVVMMTPQEKLLGASMYQMEGNRDPKKEMRRLMGLDAGPTHSRAHR